RPLMQVTLKQDARNIAPWIMGITALSVSSILAYIWIFPNQNDRAALATLVRANPAFSLIFGPAHDLATPDGFNAWRALALGGLFAALMSILIVVRHSRADEDSGQAELIASAVVGRHTRLMVAVALAALASVVLGVICSILTILFGGGVAASIALAATFTASGLMFAGVAAITAQIGSDAPSATSYAVAVLGVSFLLRGALDASGQTGWVWLSPLGWTQEVRPGSENNWWPLLACLGLAILLVAIANLLLARRDFGQGIIPPSPGPARGGAVATIWGLALRLQRGAMIAWTIAFAIVGGVFGIVASSLGDVFGNNPVIARILEGGGATSAGLVYLFLRTLLALMGILAAVYGVQVVMSIYSEEMEYRAEPLLAGALSRPKYLASNALIALLGPAVALVVGGLAIGVVASARGVDVTVSNLVGQALVEIPAVWVLIGLSLALVGANPRGRMAAWLAIVATFALTILGPTFRLWDWVLGISPLYHVPNITAPNPDFTGLAVVAAIAVAFIAVGFAGFSRRDVL
ncbi:MAG: ABC transporter permease, partial [Chloroflexia bacterium]